MAKRKKAARSRSSSRKDPLDSAAPDDGSLDGADATAKEAWKRWKESSDHLRKWRTETVESYDFDAGKQWTEEEQQSLKDQLRPVVTFNRITPTIDSVSGYEINGRQEVTYIPRQVEASGGAQIKTEAAKFFRQACDAEDNESDAFRDMVVTGLGCIEHRMDYDDDPDGMMKVERVDPLEMRYDPAAIKNNLLDRRWDIRGKWWDKKVAEGEWPDHDFADANIMAADFEDVDDKQPIDRVAASFYKDTGIGEEYERKRGKVFILEYTWFEPKSFLSALNPNSGQLEEVTKEALDSINERLAAAGMQPLKSVKRKRRIFKRAFIHGKETLEEGDAPCPESFHYQFMTGKRDRNTNHWYGLVRQMKDPQRWANKWLSQTLHIMNMGVKGTTEYEEGAFENVAKTEANLAKPGAMVKIETGFFDKVRVRPGMEIPSTTQKLTEFAIGSIRDATGVNVEVLGMANRDQPGVVEHSRKQSAMGILAPLFNSLRNYHKQAGRLTLYFIKEYLSDGRMIRIISKGEQQFLPLSKEEGFDKYDVIVDESPTSPNQKEAVFSAVASIIPALMKEGVPIPPEILDYVPGLPQQLVETWKGAIKQKAAQPPPPDPKTAIAEKKLQMESQESQAQDRIDHQRLEFDGQKLNTDNELRLREMTLKEEELKLRKEEMASKERIELARIGAQKVGEHVEHQHDVLEAAKDRLHEHVQGALGRHHEKNEGDLERTATVAAAKLKKPPAGKSPTR